MSLLDWLIGNSNDGSSKIWKSKEELDCFYDCKECPYSWECSDDGTYLDNDEDYDKY